MLCDGRLEQNSLFYLKIDDLETSAVLNQELEMKSIRIKLRND